MGILRLSEGVMASRTHVAIAAAAVALIGLGYCAREAAKARVERDEIALSIADLEGHPTCLVAWIVALDSGVPIEGTPSDEPPDVRVRSAPRVLDCTMIGPGGSVHPPLRVVERCRDLDPECVEIVGQREQRAAD